MKMGWDCRLSKAVMYGEKSIGGLGLISPSNIYYIEQCAALYRFVNSSSSITRYVMRKALLDVEQALDSNNYLEEFILNLINNNWNWIEPRNLDSSEWILIKQNKTSPDIRQELLAHLRSKMTPSLMGNLDKNNEWHRLTLNFWSNPTLSLYQQKICFANLHKAIRINNIDDKEPIICESCNTSATWDHIFWECSRCIHERTECQRLYDEISLTYNLNKIEINTTSSSPSTLTFSPNGIILKSNYKIWKKKKIVKSEVLNQIYRIYVQYVENCYKNSDWNSKLGPKRNYSISTKQKNHPTSWQIHQQLSQR
ncbi:predicted protein [Naegleria gruberi]|uniref:Predicted protein n=1 Tax=Naegleria gruberi TaxID=5762 RepID=D2VAW1_NAEGR|nr:uncharacterized protein NAEGRDRAFT_65997 [Naegleria gruberi]EFC46018.1 predicted protein [Naegleria gruberi]|eukprot:XP_002678762.1 predicted protein [Naegleria gruberi strain NEG-M]